MIRRGMFGSLLAIVALLIVFSGGPTWRLPDTRAQLASPAAVTPLEATTEAAIDFPRGILLTGTVDVTGLELSSSSSVDAFYRIGSDPTLHMAAGTDRIAPRNGSVRVEVNLDLQSAFVPAGVELGVFWRVSLANGSYAESVSTPVSWFDDRWNWQTLESSQITLRYFDLDTEFAAKILESAQTTVSDLEQRFALARSAAISIWVYPSADAFRGAQQPNSREAVAGASYPGYLLITAIIPEGNLREIGRVIPHEVSHQILQQATENPFTLPPLWFDEGIATHYQIGGTEGFLDMVVRARERGELFAIESLDASFPYAPEQATLAYATSWSVIAYIREVHGDAGIAAMIRAFGTGIPYADAIETALGMTRDDLDQEWRAWIVRRSATTAGLASAA